MLLAQPAAGGESCEQDSLEFFLISFSSSFLFFSPPQPRLRVSLSGDVELPHLAYGIGAHPCSFLAGPE